MANIAKITTTYPDGSRHPEYHVEIGCQHRLTGYEKTGERTFSRSLDDAVAWAHSWSPSGHMKIYLDDQLLSAGRGQAIPRLTIEATWFPTNAVDLIHILSGQPWSVRDADLNLRVELIRDATEDEPTYKLRFEHLGEDR